MGRTTKYITKHFCIHNHRYTLPETNGLHLKIGFPKKERRVFQPSIFRFYVSFREGNYTVFVAWQLLLHYGMRLSTKCRRLIRITDKTTSSLQSATLDSLYDSRLASQEKQDLRNEILGYPQMNTMEFISIFGNHKLSKIWLLLVFSYSVCLPTKWSFNPRPH